MYSAACTYALTLFRTARAATLRLGLYGWLSAGERAGLSTRKWSLSTASSQGWSTGCPHGRVLRLARVTETFHSAERRTDEYDDPALLEVDALLVRMFALVCEGLSAATAAFLDGDRDIARKVVAADREIDDLQRLVEEKIERRLTLGGPAKPREVRLLISMLRIAPELERSGDLTEHIALRTPQRLTAGLTPRARGLFADMASTASALWVGAANAYSDRDPQRADELRRDDDALDDLHVELTTELSRGETSIAAAIELGLVARFYERLGDHAVNVARRIRYLTDG